jgi:hypothetical protein
MALTMFEIRPEVEFEKDPLIVKVFNKKPRSFYQLKQALEFCKNNSIVNMCYCAECTIEDGEYNDVCCMSVQEIADFQETYGTIPFYLTQF